MLPADWSISPTPGTPLPFTNLRPFVPKSWVIGSILLPSCARLPHKETNTRQDTCTVEKSLRLQNTNLRIESTQITGTRPRRTCVYLGQRWPCCEWPPGLPTKFLPPLSVSLYHTPTPCQMCAKSQDPRINKASRICLPAAFGPQEREASRNK